jgi:hypothetical protein
VDDIAGAQAREAILNMLLKVCKALSLCCTGTQGLDSAVWICCIAHVYRCRSHSPSQRRSCGARTFRHIFFAAEGDAAAATVAALYEDPRRVEAAHFRRQLLLR